MRINPHLTTTAVRAEMWKHAAYMCNAKTKGFDRTDNVFLFTINGMETVREVLSVYLVWIWYVIMTCSGVCWTMLHSEFSTRVSKLCWCSAGASWLLRALRDVSDESLLAKYLLLLLLPVSQRELCISHFCLLLSVPVVLVL